MNLLPKKKQRIGKVSSTKAEVKQFETVKYVQKNKQKGYYICPKCQNYFRVHAMHRIEMVADAGTFEEWDKGLTSGNPLHYKGYEEKVEALQEKTGLDEAVVTGKARIAGNEVVLAVCDGRFMMASMGKVVGEKITRAVEKATSERIPIIILPVQEAPECRRGSTL